MKWVLVLVLALTPASAAAFMTDRSDMVPAGRLIRATELAIGRVGRQPHLLYRLARLHYMAGFLGDSEEVERIFSQSDLVTYPRLESWRRATHDPSTPISTVAHVRMALDLFREALTLQPDHALAWLGLASLVEQAEPSSAEVLGALPFEATETVFTKAGPLHERWLRQARAWYGQAAAVLATRGMKVLTYAVPGDRERRTLTEEGLQFLEAADGWHRLGRRFRIADRPAWAPTERQMRAVARHDKPISIYNYVTPIILPLQANVGLDAMRAPNRTVTFDLDGTGPRAWTWLHATAGILVWDPDRGGVVQSGHRLFGTVAWRLWWSDGYEALAQLDDNGDGWVQGSELRGLAVWQDQDGNGRSDPGEVRPVAAWGIAALATHWDCAEEHGLRSDQGLVMADGSRRPTWDWFAEGGQGCQVLTLDTF
ncbi:MAG: hypothetical protein HY902_15845 [Deltaproteobacteria bacterium]|nr:hypothetical protein [Deltaproteobacteria bacterium]